MRRSFEKGYDISIHSLRMEGDRECSVRFSVENISIHSLRMEGDLERKRLSYNIDMHFNPLPPHGGRPGKLAIN